MPNVCVKFSASPFGPASSAEAAPGERLMDICDQVEAPIPFSCRNASCGTCLVRIDAGAELLDEAGRDERSVLEALEAGPRCRLACRARVAANQGTILIAMETIGRDETM